MCLDSMLCFSILVITTEVLTVFPIVLINVSSSVVYFYYELKAKSELPREKVNGSSKIKLAFLCTNMYSIPTL